MKQKLIDRVLVQIVYDVRNGDLTAIEELIKTLPDEVAMNFLPEELQFDPNQQDDEDQYQEER